MAPNQLRRKAVGETTEVSFEVAALAGWRGSNRYCCRMEVISFAPHREITTSYEMTPVYPLTPLIVLLVGASAG